MVGLLFRVTSPGFHPLFIAIALLKDFPFDQSQLGLIFGTTESKRGSKSPNVRSSEICLNARFGFG